MTREQLTELARATSFQPFAMNLENGDWNVFELPENIAFDSTTNGRERLFVITNKFLVRSTLSAVTSVAQLDASRVSD